jgi:hypothetical protein
MCIPRRILLTVAALLVTLFLTPSAQAIFLANRVFVSARSGNDANPCNNILTPCQTFAGAVVQLNPGGEAIVLDSGGYGPVTITQSLTIEAPVGVTAFIHPPSGDAITVSAGSSDVVTLKGLTLSVGTGNGITVNSVGTLNVENCFITGFDSGSGIDMLSAGRFNVKGTDVTACSVGIDVANTSGASTVSVDHCHLDGNLGYGYRASTTPPGSSSTTATYSTANNSPFGAGWVCGNAGTGADLLSLEFCSGSENSADGLFSSSTNALTHARYSNCVFSNNGTYGVAAAGAGTVETRGNNTITGNYSGATHGVIGPFSPM